MHYIGLDVLRTRRLATPLADLKAIATPARDVTYLGTSHGVYRMEREEEPRPLKLPQGFEPGLLVEGPQQEILVLDGRGDTLVYGIDGALRRRLSLGADIADAATDDFGIFVLRRSGHLDKFTFDGRPIADDTQILRVNATTRMQEGALLLVPYDGSLWLNLEEHFNDVGERGLHLDSASIFGEGRVAGDLLGDDAVLVLTEDGRMVAVDSSGRTCDVRLQAKRIRAALGRNLTAAYDCLATRAELVTVLSTDRCALTTFEVYSE